MYNLLHEVMQDSYLLSLAVGLGQVLSLFLWCSPPEARHPGISRIRVTGSIHSSFEDAGSKNHSWHEFLGPGSSDQEYVDP